jgi:NADH:ubiquinone oxidoreductase subunit 5 (subunit L)/multisubunit Na+/H+ antiporter MnhA subunit
MFLLMGGIILHCNGCQDIRWMGGLLVYIPTLWVGYVVGGSCLIGLPYWSGYYCKYLLLQSLSNSFTLCKGIEYILLLSYIFTAIYIFRAGYLIFLGSKNGHRKIYRNKPTSLLYICSLLFLSVMILFSTYFWINLLYTNKNLLNNSIFFKSYFKINIFLDEIPYDSLYLWLIIYFLNYFCLLFWLILSINTSVNFLKYWTYVIYFGWVYYLYFCLDLNSCIHALL